MRVGEADLGAQCEKCGATILIQADRMDRGVHGDYGAFIGRPAAPTRLVIIRKECPKCGHINRVERRV